MLYKCSQEQLPLLKLQDAQPDMAYVVRNLGASDHIQDTCSTSSLANRQIWLLDLYLVNATKGEKKRSSCFVLSPHAPILAKHLDTIRHTA